MALNKVMMYFNWTILTVVLEVWEWGICGGFVGGGGGGRLGLQ